MLHSYQDFVQHGPDVRDDEIMSAVFDNAAIRENGVASGNAVFGSLSVTRFGPFAM